MLRIAEEALTFDDVLLLPAHSTVLPRTVNLQSRITEAISLNIPLISAAMDTVTEARLAIAMAQEGGLGVIHKSMTIEQQAREVRAVKKYESGVVKDPITISAQASVRDLVAVMKENNISGMPVMNSSGLAGIVTSRDVRFESNLDAAIDTIMTPITSIVVKYVGTVQREFQKRVLHWREELEANPRATPPGSPIPDLFTAFYAVLVKQNVGKKSQSELQTITDDMGTGIDCKHWVETEVTVFRMSPTRDKKFGKFQMCIRCESARDAIVGAARQLHGCPGRVPARAHAHGDTIVATDGRGAVTVGGKGDPDLAVVPDEGMDDADRPTVLRRPHQDALVGVVHQLIDFLIAEWIDGDDLVIVGLCLCHGCCPPDRARSLPSSRTADTSRLRPLSVL